MMRGSLYELGGKGTGKWRLRVFTGRENGKPRFVSRNFEGTPEEAETERRKLVADVQRGQKKKHAGSVGELLDEWIEDIEPTRSAYTLREHRRSIEKTIKPSLGSVRLDRLTAKHLDDFYRVLLRRGLSPASVRRHHSILSAALRRAVKWDWLTSNPADRATPPGLTRSRVTAPDVHDVQVLVAAAEAKDTVLAAAIALAAITGARRGELCALRWSDVDWNRRTLTIDRSLTVINQTAAEGDTKTHQRRDIAIDEALASFLSRRHAQQHQYAHDVGVTLCPDPFILSRASDGSTPCLPDGITSAYAALAKKAQVGGHFHELRHFAATTAIASGVDVKTVSSRLGHADASVTLRVYAHALEARDRELATVLGTAVLGTMDHGVEPGNAHAPTAAELERTG